jgi:hypothetical protein
MVITMPCKQQWPRLWRNETIEEVSLMDLIMDLIDGSLCLDLALFMSDILPVKSLGLIKAKANASFTH